MILKTIASLQTMTGRAIRGFLFACVLGAGGDVEANELTEITQFHARCAVPGSDMETIHDEMKAPVFLERMLNLVGHPGNWGAFHWIVGGGKDSYCIAVRQFDANADPGKLLEYLRRYVECRRLGLSKEFVLQRLVTPVPFVPPKGPAAAAVSAARQFLPGVSEQDIKPLTHYPASFPKGSASYIDVKSGLCYVMKDAVISRIFTLTKDRQEVLFDVWISSADFDELQTPEMQALVQQVGKRLTKETGRAPGRRGWIGSYWLVLKQRLARFPKISWHAPNELNPLYIVD